MASPAATSTQRKEQIKLAMTAAREQTLWLLSQVPEDFLKKRVHSFYSPIGWHFGHIGRTEEFWIVCEALKLPCIDEHYTFLFGDLPENPKDNRVNLPSREEIIEYLTRVRSVVFDLLDRSDLSSTDRFLEDGYAWEFALQHECQHQETICELMQLIVKEGCRVAGGGQTDHVQPLPPQSAIPNTQYLAIPHSSFIMGSDDLHGYDNEKRAHEVAMASFELACCPVTAAEWLGFMVDGGYRRPEHWTSEGWDWRTGEEASMPEYWMEADGGYVYQGPRGLRSIQPDEPVSCISWYEADAFARWAGARLPTEEEWECARQGMGQGCFGMTNWAPEPVASHEPNAFGLYDMAGNVWEWTSSAFLPYPGFEAFPYDGYSKDHMKGLHKVCRGGSWATSSRILRSSFRNWYVPNYRQGFLGLRLAK